MERDKPAITYEIVTAAPTEAIVALYQAGGWWEESDAWRRIIPQMIRQSFCFMVAKKGEHIIGMGRAISDGVSDAYIQDVVVLAEMRGTGIGGELVKRLAEHCAARGIGWIGLIAEPGTQAFYQRLGFRLLSGYQPMLYGQAPTP